MDSEMEKRIQETVLGILRSSNMDEVTESMIRKLASEKLQLDLSDPTRKNFVRQVVNNYLDLLNAGEEEAAPQAVVSKENEVEVEVEEEEEEDGDDKKKQKKEYDDDGNLIVCRLSDSRRDSRRVTISEFRGKTLVSMRQYYKKDGKELPSNKGISLTAEQWATFSQNVPAIEEALEIMKSRVG